MPDALPPGWHHEVVHETNQQGRIDAAAAAARLTTQQALSFGHMSATLAGAGMVELYSRTGGKLGALFLDEGFGSLDVDTLTTALEVLRTESGERNWSP